MVLAPGVRVGPYELTALLGEGGMGKVWRAHHTALRRDDALKVLPDAFAGDSDRIARFRREAQILASLNHPNIAHVYGLEEADGAQALVMELVEGPTLADRIAQGPIPVDEALAIAKQIAEALEAAHEQGIIHRDLKPANIKLRPDGTVKVLDFGLAKALEPASAGHVDATASPTITSPAMMTGVGMLLGTAAYMSPEQARGKAVDRRADIWAFGCVLYEMLTGKRAFDGEDVSETLAKVIEREPPWDALPARTPAAARRLLARCLEKSLRRRLRDMGDGLVELDEASQPESIAPPLTVRHESQPVWLRAGVPAAALLVGGLVTGTAIWLATRPAPPRVERFTIASTGAAAFAVNGTDRDLTITPDGTRIVYAGNKGSQIFVRALGQLEPTALASGVGLRAAAVSPDGQWVGFVDNTTTLKKMAMTGGPAIVVAQMDSGSRGIAWSPDDAIIFATSNPITGLQRVSAAGGEVAVLTRPDRARGESDHLWPELLPGGRAVLFTIVPLTGGPDAAQIAVLDLETATHKVLVRGGSHAQYAPTGHLVYTASGTLRAVAFDLNRLELQGTPVPVLPRLATTLQGAGDYALAADGTLVYGDDLGAGGSTARTLVWVDRRGREQPLAAPPRAYVLPRLSPDGTRILVSIADQEQDIWVWDLARETLTRLTFDPSQDGYPVWTPDGKSVFFSSQRDAAENIYRQSADGTGNVERLTKSTSAQGVTDVSPDGTRVVFHEVTATGRDLMLLSSDGRDVPLLQTPFEERNGVVSPDGRWLAYESASSGRFEIYVRPFPNVSGGQWQVSTAGGTRPLWTRNRQELFYFAPDGALMAVRIETGAGTWSAGQPTKILDSRYYGGGGFPAGGFIARTYDVSLDGQRFLMIKEASADQNAAPPHIVVVKNWDQELKRLVPTR